MIKVMIERRVKRVEDLLPLLRELREAAMRSPGFVTGETLGSIEDKSVVVIIGTWQTLADWQEWEKSDTRGKLYQRIQPLLDTRPKVSIYEALATETKGQLVEL